ncbi:MAG TPA: 2-C-methyl-D-erythritol 2,4-cyclodiphosphate synthase [Candidatus Binataceae bacterium]|jgi:2-C-methyl-D-erythritol 2,4-cyclodiphosphate synthase|nr:2-C-methyl-D-erythritol 2,4-cyclodiphosphate synthase [Candidatus Binataceae bacterium]
MPFRIGQGFDFHPFEAGRRLVLGGVEIAHSHGLRGHSDADVAAHALANALLGATGRGDLGRRFPDDDPQYCDADSIQLLVTVWRETAALGWRLVNADLTLIAQRPRLAPHLSEMCARLAQALDADASLINVKAANPEGIGALGRGEGAAASAIVLLSRE